MVTKRSPKSFRKTKTPRGRRQRVLTNDEYYKYGDHSDKVERICHFSSVQLRHTIVDCVFVVNEPPAAFPRMGTGVLRVLTGTHLCDDPSKHDDKPSERQLLLAWLLRRLCRLVSTFALAFEWTSLLCLTAV